MNTPKPPCLICGTAHCACGGETPLSSKPVSFEGSPARIDGRAKPPEFIYIDKDDKIVDRTDNSSVSRINLEEAQARGILPAESQEEAPEEATEDPKEDKPKPNAKP